MKKKFQAPIRVTAEGKTASRAAITMHASQQDDPYTSIIDEPKIRGGSAEGPTPMQTLISGLAGCTNVLLNMISEEQNVKVSDVKVEIVGYLDIAFKAERLNATPFPKVKLNVTCHTTASPEQMAFIKEELAWRCPASALFRSSGTVFEETWEVAYQPSLQPVTPHNTA